MAYCTPFLCFLRYSPLCACNACQLSISETIIGANQSSQLLCKIGRSPHCLKAEGRINVHPRKHLAKKAISSFHLVSLNYTCKLFAKKPICLGGKGLIVPMYLTMHFGVGKGHVLSVAVHHLLLCRSLESSKRVENRC